MRRALLAAALLPLAGAASAQTAPLGPAGSAIGSVSVAPAAPGFTNQQASVVPQTTIANPGGLSLGGTARGAFPSISSQTGGIQNAGGLTFGSGLSLGSLPTPTSTTLSIGATGSFGLSSLGLGATSFGTTNRFGLSTGTVSAGIGATGSTATSSTGGGFGGSGAGIATGTTVDPTRQTGVRATGGAAVAEAPASPAVRRVPRTRPAPPSRSAAALAPSDATVIHGPARPPPPGDGRGSARYTEGVVGRAARASSALPVRS